MIEKLDKNIKLSFFISFGAHIIIFIILLLFADFEHLGIEKKLESQRLKARLVRLVQSDGGAKSSKGEASDSKISKSSKMSESMKWKPQTTSIEFSDELPKITVPTINRSERMIKKSKRVSKKDDYDFKIKKSDKKSGKDDKDVDVKYIKEDNINNIEGDDDFDRMMGKIDGDVKKSGSGKGEGDIGKKGRNLPTGLSIDEVIGGGGEAVWSKYNKMPVYPEEAQNNAWEGDVKLRLDIDKSGRVRRVFIDEKSGYPVLDKSAKAAARRWKIYIIDKGLQLSGVIKITVSFRLKN